MYSEPAVGLDTHASEDAMISISQRRIRDVELFLPGLEPGDPRSVRSDGLFAVSWENADPRGCDPDITW
jgi:hypothetical protein